MQECILALGPPVKYPDIAGNPTQQDESLVLGQRFLSKYQFMAIVNRNDKTLLTGIQSGDVVDIFAQFYTLAFIILGIILLLMFLLCYLVWLRSRRIKAEKWLVEHQDEIVSYAMYKKTEEIYN